MIVNLTGPQAAGKTSFACWFVARNPTWQHLAIDEFRRQAVSQLASNPEEQAIEYLSIACKQARDVIIESTGTVPSFSMLWCPELVDRGIYTIKLTAPIELCQKRARERYCEPIPGYDLDDCYGLLVEEELISKLPAHLTVEICDELDKEEIVVVYREVERYILRAQAIWHARLNSPLRLSTP